MASSTIAGALIDALAAFGVKRLFGIPGGGSSLDLIEAGAQLLIQLRNMERLADHATNIAEDVIFFTQAKTVRNRFDQEAFEELQRDLNAANEFDDDRDEA